MNSYERVKAVLEGRVPDRVPKFDQIWPETLERWIKEGYPAEIWPEDLFDYDFCMIGGINEEARLGESVVLEETEEWITCKDGNGAILKTWKHKMGCPEHIGFTVNTREAWEDLKGHLQVEERRLGNIDELRKNVAYQKQKERFTSLCLMDLFESGKNVLGHEEMLVNMALDPEWMEDVFQTYTDFEIGMLELFFSYDIPVDAIWVWGDLAYNHGPFYSPDMYRKMIQKHHSKLFRYIHSKGLPVIFHTCGRAMEIVPLLVESGIDCLQPMEAKAGMDVRELKRLYGDRISFMGNIDVTILSTGDWQRIEDEVRSKILIAKEHGGYIYHSDHSVPPSVSLETYRYVMELVDRYGRY